MMEHKVFRGPDCIRQMKEFNRKRFQEFTGLSEEEFRRKPDESIEAYRGRIDAAIGKKHPGLVNFRMGFRQPAGNSDTRRDGGMRFPRGMQGRGHLNRQRVRKHKESSDVKG